MPSRNKAILKACAVLVLAVLALLRGGGFVRAAPASFRQS
jgi:hypothetical protein